MEKRVLAGRAWPAGSGAGEGLPLPWVAGGTGPGAFLERGGTARHGTAVGVQPAGVVPTGGPARVLAAVVCWFP